MTGNISRTSNGKSRELSATNNGWLSKIVSCLIPFIPLLIYYFVPFTTVSFDTAVVFAVSAFVILSVIGRNERIGTKNCGFYFLLVLWTLAITTLFFFLGRYRVNYGMGLWYILPVFFTIFGVEKGILNSRLIIKTYRVLASVAILLVIVQWIVFLLFGYRLSFMFLFLPFNDAYEFLEEHFVTAGQISSASFAAFFSERSHFCLFITPFLCMSIYDAFQKKERVWLPILTTAVMLSTTSGNGIVVSAVAWIVAALFLIKGKKKIVCLILVILLVLGVFLFLKRIPEFEAIFRKMFTRESEYSHSKADYRIYRGFDYYSQLPTFNKLFGIGYRCLDSSFAYYHLADHYNTTGEYMGCLGQILVYSGALGMLLFLLFVGKLFFSSNNLSRTVLICFLAYCVSSSIYFDAIWIMYFAIVFSLNRLLNQDLRRPITNDAV